MNNPTAPTTLTNLPEIGPVLARQLSAIGIHDPAALRQAGSHDAFCRIRDQVDPGACLHLLMALEAAIQNKRTTMLAPEEKSALRTWFTSLSQS